MENAAKILIVDDHALVRAGLKKMLDTEAGLEIVGEAADGIEAMTVAKKHQPDVVILDVAMPKAGGLETISVLLDAFPTMKVIILSMYGKESFAQEALRSGAHAYILKGDPGEVLVEAIHAVLEGKYYFSDQIQAALVKFFRQEEHDSDTSELRKYYALSDREKEVFQLMMDGKTTVEISTLLDISPKTGEKHRTSIVKKLGMSNPVEMVKYAIRMGLIDPNPFDI